ncbi:MAG TPA: esterase [Bacillus bacterium]|nr:esterase [Bacillus sp. (in: firmicutes)]
MIETINLLLFGQKRKIRIYLPADYYVMGKRYPVIYMHDGQNVFDSEEAIGGVSLELHDYLAENKVELMVVAIDQNPEERLNEYCPWRDGEFCSRVLGKRSTTGGKGKEYVEFIVNELKPLIDEKYRTDKNETYMAGISLGALITTYAACTYPYIFKRIAGVSSAFYRNQEELEEMLKAADLTEVEKIYLDCGIKEVPEEERISELFLQSNKAIHEMIKQKGIKAEVKLVDGALHNYQSFKKRIPDVFTYLLS